jgi:hypothetical protein
MAELLVHGTGACRASVEGVIAGEYGACESQAILVRLASGEVGALCAGHHLAALYCAVEAFHGGEGKVGPEEFNARTWPDVHARIEGYEAQIAELQEQLKKSREALNPKPRKGREAHANPFVEGVRARLVAWEAGDKTVYPVEAIMGGRDEQFFADLLTLWGAVTWRDDHMLEQGAELGAVREELARAMADLERLAAEKVEAVAKADAAQAEALEWLQIASSNGERLGLAYSLLGRAREILGALTNHLALGTHELNRIGYQEELIRRWLDKWEADAGARGPVKLPRFHEVIAEAQVLLEGFKAAAAGSQMDAVNLTAECRPKINLWLARAARVMDPTFSIAKEAPVEAK